MPAKPNAAFRKDKGFFKPIWNVPVPSSGLFIGLYYYYNNGFLYRINSPRTLTLEVCNLAIDTTECNIFEIENISK